MKAEECPICAGIEVELDDERLFVFRCVQCGHIFTKIPFEQQVSYAEDYYFEKHRRWFENPDLSLFQKILSGLNVSNDPRKSLLDVGCGKGDFLRFARKSNPEIQLVGIDTTSNSGDGVRYISGDFNNHDFGAEKFDYIVSTMVVEHVEDPCFFIRKIKSLLAPGGMVMLDTINSGALLHKIARALRAVGIRLVFDRLYDHHHLQHYNNSSLKRLVTDAGLTLRSHRNHNFPLKAVDVPNHGPLLEGIYRIAVAGIFAVTDVCGGELCQSVLCEAN